MGFFLAETATTSDFWPRVWVAMAFGCVFEAVRQLVIWSHELERRKREKNGGLKPPLPIPVNSLPRDKRRPRRNFGSCTLKPVGRYRLLLALCLGGWAFCAYGWHSSYSDGKVAQDGWFSEIKKDEADQDHLQGESWEIDELTAKNEKLTSQLKTAVTACLNLYQISQQQEADKQKLVDALNQAGDSLDKIQDAQSMSDALQATNSAQPILTLPLATPTPIIPPYQPPVTTSGFITHPDGSMTSVNLISAP